MAEDLTKEVVKFGYNVAKNAIIGVAVIVAILLVLFVLNIATENLIELAKQGINFIQYVATTLL
jgi:hypothetical protein